MSGGAFDYQQRHLQDAAETITELIQNECGVYPPEVVKRFREARLLMEKAFVAWQRIDWLLCGDDGPETFLRRWDDEMRAVVQRDKERTD